MNHRLHSSLFTFLLLSSTLLNAQRSDSAATNHSSNKTAVHDCNVPTSKTVLDVNNVKATLLNAGDVWFNPTTQLAGYEVPKGTVVNIAYPQALFAGAIWISGLDQGGNLRIAAETYRSNGVDFYSGPLDSTANTEYTICNRWDRHFSVWATQINSVIAAYAQQGNTGRLPLSAISDSVLYWPGKGNPHMAALGYDMSSVLAPFYDANSDGIYDPQDGDYPTLKQGGAPLTGCGAQPTVAGNNVYADQMVFWVMNDNGNAHRGSQTTIPIGVQVNALAFAFRTNDEVNDMTFYHYDFINKSGTTLTETYISQYTDVDLGCPNNDAIGCDTTRSLAFAYNGIPQGATNNPGNNFTCDDAPFCVQGTVGYKCDLPMIGIQMLEGPTDTTIDAQTGQPHKLGMTAFSDYINSSGPGGPFTESFRNRQLSLDYNNQPYSYQGVPIKFMYPSDPSSTSGWSQCNPYISAGDRRFLQTTGPFTFLPCASQSMTIAVIFAQHMTSNCPSLSRIDSIADMAQHLFDAGYSLSGHTGPATGVDMPSANTWKIYPNPATDMLYIESGIRSLKSVDIYDMTGREVMAVSDGAASINISILPAGMYVIRASDGVMASYDKIVKK